MLTHQPLDTRSHKFICQRNTSVGGEMTLEEIINDKENQYVRNISIFNSIQMKHYHTHALNTKIGKEWGKQINGLEEIFAVPAYRGQVVGCRWQVVGGKWQAVGDFFSFLLQLLFFLFFNVFPALSCLSLFFGVFFFC